MRSLQSEKAFIQLPNVLAGYETLTACVILTNGHKKIFIPRVTLLTPGSTPFPPGMTSLLPDPYVTNYLACNPLKHDKTLWLFCRAHDDNFKPLGA